MDTIENQWFDEFVPVARMPKPRIYPGDVLIDVKPHMVGKIIGKFGMTVKGMQQESGASISIIDSENDGMKSVKISGPQRAKILAQKLVKDLIENNDRGKFNQNHVEEVTNESNISMSDLNGDDLRKKLAENLVKKDLSVLSLIVKSFYNEHPEVAALSDKQVEDFRFSKNIIVKYIDKNINRSVPKPVLTFSHAFKDYPEVMKALEKQNLEIPSPVQCQAWPIIMNGNDLIAISPKKSGKTLAFLLPAFIHIDSQQIPRQKRKGPTALVLAPTRELVIQIENEVKKYSYKGIKSISIYEVDSFKKQQECLLERVEIVIATPGHLNDFINRSQVDLSDVSYLIFDEVDCMLNLGFEPQIRLLLFKVRPNRQTIMTTATWPSGLKQLVKNYTSNAIQIMVGSVNLTIANNIEQSIFLMEQGEKELWLYVFLVNISKEEKVMIFVNHKMDVDELLLYLYLKGFHVDSIYSGRNPADCEKALENLRNGSLRILIATDVASRGIDLDDVTVIINYNMAKNIEEFVHRVGNTGRGGKTGHVITLMTKYDLSKAKDLIELMKKSGITVPKELYYMEKRFEDNNRERAKEIRPFRSRDGNK